MRKLVLYTDLIHLPLQLLSTTPPNIREQLGPSSRPRSLTILPEHATVSSQHLPPLVLAFLIAVFVTKRQIWVRTFPVAASTISEGVPVALLGSLGRALRTLPIIYPRILVRGAVVPRILHGERIDPLSRGTPLKARVRTKRQQVSMKCVLPVQIGVPLRLEIVTDLRKVPVPPMFPQTLA